MRIDFADHTRTYFGLYEIELNRHLRRLCRAGDHCFDVGAQVGYDALVLARLSGTGRVLSLEAESQCLEEMTRNFAANPSLAPRITGRLAFVASESDPSRGRLSLDDAAYGPGGFVPDFIKMDIEGGEADALAGAARILAERHPRLVVEVHGEQIERDCLELLRGHGYEPARVRPRRWLPDHRPIGFNGWLIAG